MQAKSVFSRSPVEALADTRLIEDPEWNLKVIMKDGQILKNTLG
jgi:hypothetical protein